MTKFVPVLLALVLCGSTFAQSPRFVDVTAGARLGATHDRGPDPHPLTVMYGGGAVGDFNRDGWPDIFVLSGGVEPDRLYINRGNGTFTDRAAQWGVDRVHAGGGAVVGDFNSDGYPDIFATSIGPDTNSALPDAHILYQNRRGESFQDVAFEAGVHTIGVGDGFGAAFGDYDLDGDLDLFVTSWRYEIGGNTLYRNNGNGTFSDVTDDVIDQSLIDVRGFTPCFADMDGDLFPELLISADFRTSTYCINNADGTFTRKTRAETGITEDNNGMGAVVADINHDGRLDWFISNIYEEVGLYSGFGQALYISQETPHTFIDTAPEAGVENGHWGWGTDAIDLNNDAILDLVQVNGWPTQGYDNDPALMWLCLSIGNYVDVSRDAGFVDHGLGRGLSSLDYDRDGDLDLLIFNNSGPLKLFRNDTPREGNRYIRVDLDTSARPDLAPNGMGARIELTIGDTTQHRYVDGAMTFLTCSQLTEHFGIGAHENADRIRVVWPDGGVSDFEGMKGDTVYTLKAPPTCAYPDADGDGEPDFGNFDPTFDGVSGLEDLYATARKTYDIDLNGIANQADAWCMRDFVRRHETYDAMAAR